MSNFKNNIFTEIIDRVGVRSAWECKRFQEIALLIDGISKSVSNKAAINAKLKALLNIKDKKSLWLAFLTLLHEIETFEILKEEKFDKVLFIPEEFQEILDKPEEGGKTPDYSCFLGSQRYFVEVKTSFTSLDQSEFLSQKPSCKDIESKKAIPAMISIKAMEHAERAATQIKEYANNNGIVNYKSYFIMFYDIDRYHLQKYGINNLESILKQDTDFEIEKLFDKIKFINYNVYGNRKKVASKETS